MCGKKYEYLLYQRYRNIKKNKVIFKDETVNNEKIFNLVKKMIFA